jgi:non-ribosomal peptide synthase protein (TIGR01720 family)
VAYVVGESGVVVDPVGVRGVVGRRLPGYMVPVVVVVGVLPVTANGKVDRKALPAPEYQGGLTGRRPRTEHEEVLCGLFAELLGVAVVGVDDSFFELGGDSINSIQLVSRARILGVHFTPRDVFQHQTVSGLAQLCAGQAVMSSPGKAGDGVGSAPLLPIMRWLLECADHVSLYTMSYLLRPPVAIDRDRLAQALQAVLDRHDVLRARLVMTGTAQDRCLDIPAPGTVRATELITRIDTTSLEPAARQALMTLEAERARQRLAPESAVMLQAVWFDEGVDQPGRLLLVLHHLAFDIVSWQVVIPDMLQAWQAIEAGQVPLLPPVGTSFRTWARHLNELAHAPDRVAELPAWMAVLGSWDPLIGVRALDPVRDFRGSDAFLRVALSVEDTEALLARVSLALAAGIHDLLVTAFALALARWRHRRGRAAPGSPVLVNLESHGRDTIVDGMDLSRTVGMFLKWTPVCLDPGVAHSGDAQADGPACGAALIRVMEQLRAVPDNGLGFGLLRYLNDETAPVLAAMPQPQVLFSYLGRPGRPNSDNHGWVQADDGVLIGGVDPRMKADHSLMLDAMIVDGPDGPYLIADWCWIDGILDEGAVRDLAGEWFDALAVFIGWAEKVETAIIATPDPQV